MGKPGTKNTVWKNTDSKNTVWKNTDSKNTVWNNTVWKNTVWKMQYIFPNIYKKLCFVQHGQRHLIDKTKKYLGKNSFRLNCDRLAMVQFLQDRQSVSLFWESNYSRIIAKALETGPRNSSLKSE